LFAHSVALVFGLQTQTPEPPHTSPEGHVHVTVPPHPSLKLPHALFAHSVALVFGLQPQTPAVTAPHELLPEHPQLTVWPHPSLSIPHWTSLHGVTGAQPHTSATPPPPHVCGVVHEPQETVAAQLFVAVPQFLFAHAVTLSGTQVHSDVGDPTHV
jgi:hypothetical protein